MITAQNLKIGIPRKLRSSYFGLIQQSDVYQSLLKTRGGEASAKKKRQHRELRTRRTICL